MDELRQRLAHLTPEMKSLLALRLQEKQPRKDSFFYEPIAITGIGCRFPGGVTDTFSYWQLLSQAGDAITEIPADRWNVSAYYDSQFAVPGKMNTRWGGFLDEIDKFDPKFFNISPREVVNLDPQQRLLLEICWEALRDAAVSPESLNGSSTGVFIGISARDYTDLQLRELAPESIDAYYGTGNSASFAAGRISYWLGAQGPSMAVDTACSSSLVAVHLACQSLRTGECQTALAGGVNLILSPLGGIYLSQVRALSPTGRCKTFSAEADGMVRGEGCGIVVLKRLSDARRDGDRIWAVIRGSAVNQDGKSNGLTAPNGAAQEAVIRQALANAQVTAAEIGYVEAHGTGTPLGDPIEVRALQAVLKRESVDRRLIIGSVKTNIGHLEAAAGIAGLIKTALSLNQRSVPASLHFEKPNPYIPWAETSMEVPSSLMPWDLLPSREKRIAGVSSFGFSGTNAHVIVEECSSATRKLAPSAPNPWKKERYWIGQPVRSNQGDRVGKLKAEVEVSSQAVLLTEKLIQENTELNSYFQQLRRQFGGDGCFAVNRFQLAPLVFFTAQRNSFFYVNRIENSLIALMYVGSSENLSASIREFVQYAERQRLQPKIFVLEDELNSAEECGLSATPCGVWQGITDLESFALSGNRMRRLRYVVAHYQKYGQIEVKEYFHDADHQTAAEIEDLIDEWVIHKEKSATFVEPLKRLLNNAERINDSHRFFLIRRNDKLESVIVLSPYGNNSGFLMDLEFYRRDVPLGCVEFGIVQIIETLKREGFQKLSLGGTFGVKLEAHALADTSTTRFFIELHNQQILNGDSNYQFKAKFRPQEKRMFVCQPPGADYNALYDLLLMLSDPLEMRHSARKNSHLQIREDYLTSSNGKPDKGIAAASPSYISGNNPLLGRELRLAAVSEKIFEMRLDRRRLSYLWKHRLRSRSVLPGTAFLEMLQAFAATYFKGLSPVLQDVLLHAPLFLDQGEEFIIQIKALPLKESLQQVNAEIYSLIDGDDNWQLHVTARLAGDSSSKSLSKFSESIADIQTRCPQTLTKTAFYQKLLNSGFEYDAMFQGVERIRFSEREVISLVELPFDFTDELTEYHFHPALFDACLQTMTVFLPQFNGSSTPDLFLMKGLEKLRIHLRPEKRLWCYASRHYDQTDDPGVIRADLFLINEIGELVASIEGIEAKQVSQSLFSPKVNVPENDWFYKIAWERSDLPDLKTSAKSSFNKLNLPFSESILNIAKESRHPKSAAWLIFGKEDCELTRNILELLTTAGIPSRLVLPVDSERQSSLSSSFSSFIDSNASTIVAERIKIEESQSYRDVVQRWSASSVSSGLPETGVVLWLWSAAADGDLASASVSAESAAAAQWQASLAQCRRLLFLMQALAEVDLTTGAAANVPRLWVITAGAQPVGGGAFDIAQSPTVPGEIDAMPETGQLPAASAAGVWGMGRVFSREHPSLWGGSIDLEPYRAIRHKAVQSSPGTGGAEVVEAATARAAALELYREIRNACRGLEKDGTSGGGGSSSGISSSSESLIEEASEGGREEQIGYRRGERFVARLERVEEEVSASLRLRERAVRSDGWYLISGGLGGLGLAVGEWLLEQGAGRVVLASRGSGSEFEEEEEAESRRSGGRDEEWRIKVEELERRFGTERVAARRMDVSDWRQVRKLIEEEDGREEPGQRGQARNEQRERERERAQEGKPKERLRLRGVIQSAGEVSDAVLERQDEEKFERAMRAKVAGGWNLHYATLSEELDFFILFSSAVVILGNPGQINHAAANSLLDGLAHYRRSIGLTALSINWGAWDEIGAALKSNVGKRAAQHGIEMIKPVQGLAAFARLLRTNESQIAVLPTDWNRWRTFMQYSNIPAFFDSVNRIQSDKSGKVPIEKSLMSTIPAIESASDNLDKDKLRNYLRQIVSELLELSKDELDEQTELNHYGFDSLMAIDLRSRLLKDRKVNLAVSDLFRNLTLAKLQMYVESQLEVQPVASSDELLSKIEQLSEAEIDILLKQKLAI